MSWVSKITHISENNILTHYNDSVWDRWLHVPFTGYQVILIFSSLKRLVTSWYQDDSSRIILYWTLIHIHFHLHLYPSLPLTSVLRLLLSKFQPFTISILRSPLSDHHLLLICQDAFDVLLSAFCCPSTQRHPFFWPYKLLLLTFPLSPDLEAIVEKFVTLWGSQLENQENEGAE